MSGKKRVEGKRERKESPVDKISQEKQKALQLTLQQIEKQFGKGAIMTLGQESLGNIATIQTGSLALDIATGVGGVPRGRVIEIYGPEGSGKTTLTLSIAAQVQK